MRLSRFADTVRKQDASDRAGFAEALFFDVRQPDNEDEETLAAQRVAALHHVPLLLGIAHLLCAIAVMVQTRGDFAPLSAGTVVIPILVALACDAAAYVVLRLRDRLDLSPRAVTLTICALVAITSAMWSFFGHVVSWIPGMGEGALLPLLIGAGITAGAVVSISSPPLAIVCAFVGSLGASMFSLDATFIGGVAALSLVLVGYSVAIARTMIAASRKRQALDHEARKALHFVNEFEMKHFTKCSKYWSTYGIDAPSIHTRLIDWLRRCTLPQAVLD